MTARAWHRKDLKTGEVIVVGRNYVRSQIEREHGKSREEADRWMAAMTGRPIELTYATYWFGGDE